VELTGIRPINPWIRRSYRDGRHYFQGQRVARRGVMDVNAGFRTPRGSQPDPRLRRDPGGGQRYICPRITTAFTAQRREKRLL
jgi:hypothetical protein